MKLRSKIINFNFISSITIYNANRKEDFFFHIFLQNDTNTFTHTETDETRTMKLINFKWICELLQAQFFFFTPIRFFISNIFHIKWQMKYEHLRSRQVPVPFPTTTRMNRKNNEHKL